MSAGLRQAGALPEHKLVAGVVAYPPIYAPYDIHLAIGCPFRDLEGIDLLPVTGQIFKGEMDWQKRCIVELHRGLAVPLERHINPVAVSFGSTLPRVAYMAESCDSPA